jgi:hypothetical protein
MNQALYAHMNNKRKMKKKKQKNRMLLAICGQKTYFCIDFLRADVLLAKIRKAGALSSVK